MPATIRNSVDFPDPFSPMRPIHSPLDTTKETSVNTRRSWKVFDTASTRRCTEKTEGNVIEGNLKCWKEACRAVRRRHRSCEHLNAHLCTVARGDSQAH